MMKPSLLSLSLALALSAPLAQAAKPAHAPTFGAFGVDLSARDTSVKPGDDFNRYANGHWLDTYQLKDYETRFGSFNALSDEAEAQSRDIIEALGKRNDIAPGSNAQKVRDFYASYMNTAARDAAGIAPLKPLLDKIALIDSKAALVAAFGDADVDGTASPVGMGVSLDRKNPDRYLVG